MGEPRHNTIYYRSATGTENFTFRVWGGGCWLSITNAQNATQKVYSKMLKPNELALIAQYMQDLSKSQEAKEISLVYNGWNRQDRKRIMEFIIVLKKDEQKVFHIIVKVGNASYDFPILYNNTIAYGTGEIPEAERSVRAWNQLIYDLKTLYPIEMFITNNRDMPPNGQGGQRSGGYNRQSGGNSGGSYSGQGDFKPSGRNLPSDDDIFQQD